MEGKLHSFERLFAEWMVCQYSRSFGLSLKPVREASQADETLPRKEAGHSLGLNSHGLCAHVFSVCDGKFQALESTVEGI